MNASTSTPSLSSKKPPSETLAGSGSFESHLSVLHTQQRVRPAPQHSSDSDPKYAYTALDPTPPRAYLRLLRGVFSEAPNLSLPPFAPDAHTRSCRSAARWMLYVYYFVSSVFLSASLYRVFFVPSTTGRTAADIKPSYLDALPMSLRLSRVSGIYPLPRTFQPYVYRPTVDPHAVTACLWASDTDIDWIAHWLTHWKGPISLLVTTHRPKGPARAPLPRKLSAFLRAPAFNTSLLALHVLHLDPATKSDTPNAFLNLARLFAPTANVLLVPGRTPPPAAASAPAAASWPALSSVLLPRDAPVWCTERFFTAAPGQARSADWEECLWQLYLDSFGRMPALREPRWPSPPTDSNAVGIPVEAAIRRRLSARYKSETCVLAQRKLEALAVEEKGRIRGADADNMRWLKTVCKEWTSD
ncbi:hypothetical protein FA95DRAFT_1518915 [Auriscalpium vulgare]|uniref:Uncharacterized protein n=1 Tax=Auriscalpium vulgare TaxID=40419 RepID=A0ACB8RV86_9AGAM|nr:hypothetical protein FA95DRAFT_1518915 [Auriscalpium vulgare]